MDSTPMLRIDTDISQDEFDALNDPFASPNAPPAGRDRARSISQTLLPQLRLSMDRSSSSRPSDAGSERPTMSLGMEKARNESRKLLAHILAQLEARSMPPPLFEGADARAVQGKKGIAAVVRSFSGKGKAADAKQANANDDDDSDEDYDPADRPAFFTDGTLKLMGQLRDTLHISLTNNWDIFSGDNIGLKPGRNNSFEKPRRKRRLSSQGRSRSRSASPSRFDEGPAQAPELLSQCIAILSSVIVKDCRFRVYTTNLKKPPHTLQLVTLDVAQILLHMHRDEPRILSRIGFSLIPAFQSFPLSMHARLLQFFEEGVLGGMLESLQKLQGKDAASSPTNAETPDDEPPVVSITVEEVQDEFSHNDRWKRWSKRATVQNPGYQSSSAPEQDIAVYYLASLVEPLLSAILENVELFPGPKRITDPKLTTDPKLAADPKRFIDPSRVIHRFHRLFTRLTQEKPDVYLDVLGVIAYHSPKSRYAATSLLLTYWPKSVGHVIVSRPLSKILHATDPASDRHRSSVTRRSLSGAVDHPYAHQFVPWRFVRPPSSFGMFDEFAPNRCRACADAIEGFGLLCPFCMCAVHFDCYDYPEGSFFTEYALQSDPNIQKVAVHRFCHILPSRHGDKTLTVRKEQHVFRLVNTFSMSLCCLCATPLWGTVMQGYKCGACHLFVHPSCLAEADNKLPRCREVNVDSSFMTISYAALRQSFIEHYRDFIWTESEVETATHEEVTVLFSTLWNQLQILNNGMALGSVVITLDHTSDSEEMEDFELHQLVDLYEDRLSSGQLPVSSALQDFLSENNLRAPAHLAYFDWNALAFIASVAKLPPASEGDGGDPSALLSVSAAGAPPDDEPPYPYEAASLAHVRDRLGDALGLQRDAPARALLVHLHHLGLLERHDAAPVLLADGADAERVQVCFPLPFGFDITLEVETLVATVEACLGDIHLSVNEVGLLLLVRRFWPNGVLSDYSFRRLAKAILSWILSEDGNLALILREYVARGKDLPGVRSGEAQAWPTQSLSRPTATITASNGGDYVASRKALLQSYATPWMLALHDLDVTAYANILYDLLFEYAEEGAYTDPFVLGEGRETQDKARKKRAVEVGDRFLRAMIKISQASIAFTAFDELFQRWLESMQDAGGYEVAVPALPRLFTREDGSSRHSLVFDGRSSMGDLAGLANVNPLQSLMTVSFASRDGYQRGLRWLCVFAASGVDIPLPLFYQFAGEAPRFRATLDDCLVLARACLYAAWLRSIGRQELQAVAGMLHEYLAQELVAKLWAGESGDVLTFIRMSLAMCLLLYGCDRHYIISLDFVKKEEVDHLPSRRKIGSRASTMTDPIIVDLKLMNAVKLYVEQHVDELSCMLAKFLNAFVNETQLVESYEVDNFILRNCVALSACMWDFYAIQVPELSLKRSALFVRVMAVDSQPLLALLRAHHKHEDWEVRLETILRLFRIILDVTSPAFGVHDRQWGPSVVEVFQQFFSTLWTEEKEEVRLAVDTWSQTLLPAHHDAIARCWNEALSKLPVAEKLKLVNFLCQLRPHFPSWKVLSWDTIIEALLESEFITKNGPLENGRLSFYGISTNDGDDDHVSDPDSALLRVALLSLSLRMVADGIAIETFSLLKLKRQLLLTFGYDDVSLVPSTNGHTFYVQFRGFDMLPPTAIPCLADLMVVLDSAQSYDVASAAMGGPDVDDDTSYSLLIGSVFVDVLIDLAIHLEELASIPPLALKNLLKAMVIAMQKHDFESQPLRHLHSELRKAMRCVLMTFSDDDHLSLELRQLSLSACQVSITRWPGIMGVFVYDAIEIVTRVMVALHYEEHPEDSLVIQSRLFLDHVLTMFYGRGILNVLFKRVLTVDFFKTLNKALSAKSVAAGQPSLRDALLYDTLSRAQNNDGDSYQLVLDNINMYIELVHHSSYTLDIMQFVGSSLTSIAHKIGDWPVDTFDASSLLLIPALLIQHNKSHSRDLISQVGTIIHMLLGRCRFSYTSLSRILQVTAALYRKADVSGGGVAPNLVLVAFLESVSEILTSKNKPISTSFSAALELVTSDVGLACIARQSFFQLAEDSLQYLHSYNTMSPWHQDFVTCQWAAKIVLRAAEENIEIIRHLENSPLTVRTWNMIILAALSATKSPNPSILLQYFHAFVLVYYNSLEPLQAIASEYQGLGDIESSHISRAYVGIKLWLLVVLKTLESSPRTPGEESGDIANAHQCRTIWNELWPPFEAVVVNLMHTNGAANALLLASSSVADLFLFLHHTRIVLSLESSSQVSLLTRLQSNSRLESKIARVLRLLTEPPPDHPTEYYISQIAAEISAEEKLEAARLQESMKPAWDRGRRVAS